MVLRFGAWCAITASNVVIVISRSVADELAERYPTQRHKIAHIPNGATMLANADVGADESRLARFGLERGKYVLAVGRLVPEKGFHDLIAAFKGTDGDFKLAIAGKADHQDAYSEALVRQSSERIVFTGFQDHATLRVLYEGASLFVLPSYHEGLPIAALEAARMGVPLLLSDIQPNRDIGLDRISYFPVGDVDALRERLISDHDALRPDPEAIARRFDWDAIARATARVYRSVMGNAGSGAFDRVAGLEQIGPHAGAR
jgi:glycosyltransferase involved in cell wall biosynthesis